ncbi:MAG: terpene cyclase/mutase family protein [Planctomycetia bacterium]|nr:terpene cyclase/mutase family protein [Planctomycetia bacterium]
MTRSAVFLLLAGLLVLTAGSPHLPAALADPPAKEEKKGIDRTGATKKRLLKEFGGSEESEEAVMLGLAWLTQMQKKEGNWVYDIGVTNDKAAATGMATLAFLGAGQSHKAGRYKQTVQAALDWLVKNVDMKNGPDRGKFNTISNMYSQGIATLALCEAYGMTQDSSLKDPAQTTVNYIQQAQGKNGSWGYNAKNNGDTSIVGWQIQALHAAKLAGLDVDQKVIQKAIEFLDFASSGQNKSAYGYLDKGRAAPATSLTAVGLLCRYYIDDWRSETAGFAEGSKGLMKRVPSAGDQWPILDLYYYYYATQVVRYHGGDEWKTWNEGLKKDGSKGGMADWLIELQVKDPAKRGSWDPEPGWIGRGCGRLGTTCLCLLTLEVYYRYDPNEGQKPKKP